MTLRIVAHPASRHSLFREHDGPRAGVRLEDVRRQALAEIDLRLAVVGRVDLVLDDVEFELFEGAAHVVETVLGLDDHFVEPRVVAPRLALLRGRPEVSLAAPVPGGAADPAVEDVASL